MHDKVLILDFGSQYTQLIARRVREAQVYCEIHPFDVSDAFVRSFGAKGVILSGGPASAYEAVGWRAPEVVFSLGVPVLGICYGMQVMAEQLGGRVAQAGRREFGQATVQVCADSPLFSGLADRVDGEGRRWLDVWMSHGDAVVALPPGFAVTARNESTPIAAMADEGHRWYGVQFHPEVTHTHQGRALIERFLFEICGCRGDWTMPAFIPEAIDRIRATVGEDEVILGLSGGVDSSVAAALLHRAIGDRLTAIFVDNGLLRAREGEEVRSALARHLGVRVMSVDAADRFLAALSGVSEPEEKRRIVGRLFVEVFEEVARQRPNARWLAQGTIYPDVIESAAGKTKKAAAIKSHHNVGGLPERLQLRLLEPLRELFKDEVRALGVALGLPHELVYRHPFPGPGLAVRVVGAVTREALTIVRQADAIFLDELRAAGWYEKVSQAFAVFLPVRSVGVMGDNRTYEHVIALRAVESEDFMTARAAELPWELLARVAHRIINEVSGVNRVVYDVSSKPPATIEWE
ncbi:MAG: glutamine-hydrolyzing GMP synthase [Hydrogenophilus sp.]|nr:glutamine-hydrolyzing GMP synthase [Hydrogenophilus sp.]